MNNFHNFVFEVANIINNKIVASSSSLIIDFDLYADSDNWQTLSDSGYITNHDPDAETLYGIEIMVHPDFRSMKLARRLYEARKEIVKKYNLRNIVIGGRIPNYLKYYSRSSYQQPTKHHPTLIFLAPARQRVQWIRVVFDHQIR